jgi:hypothetical protein
MRLAAALAGRDPPVTLVLDDLHLLTDLMVLDGLDYVLRNAGSGLRLAVCSRMDPLLPLHRCRLAGQLAEIRSGDLAFSTGEAGLLLARHGRTLTADVLAGLMRRTDRWAAGLRLAAQDPPPSPRWRNSQPAPARQRQVGAPPSRGRTTSQWVSTSWLALLAPCPQRSRSAGGAAELLAPWLPREWLGGGGAGFIPTA